MHESVKLLDNLPVGIFIHKQFSIEYINQAAKKLLYGDEDANTEMVYQILKINDQFKKATGFMNCFLPEELKADFSNTINNIPYKNSKEEEYPIGLVSIISKFKGETCKICILQNQSLQADLEKERSGKEYMKSFFSMITHELRNPLHGIMGIFEGILEQIPRSDKGMKTQCKLGLGTTKLMMRLINDLLDISQLETRKFRLVDEEFKPKNVIQECMELMKFKYNTKGIELFYKEENYIPTMICDKNRYRQILLNLLGNALKFTEKGNVSISCMYEYGKKLLITSVKDTGVGVKSEDSSKLFSFFEKLNDTASMNPQGSGLGLYISRKLTEAMGGYIILDSIPLEGTTVTFGIKSNTNSIENISECSIPSERLEDTETNKDQDRIITHASFLDKSRENIVLVVDDELICANTLQRYLKYCGLETDIVFYFNI